MTILPTVINKQKRWPYLQILEDYSIGMNALTISKKRQCSREFVTKVLADLNSEAREQMKDLVITETPLQYRASITLLKKIIETCQTIVDKSIGDGRVQRDCLSLQRECSRDITDLLADSSKIALVIAKLERKQQGKPTSETAESGQPTEAQELEEEGVEEDGQSVNDTVTDEEEVAEA